MAKTNFLGNTDLEQKIVERITSFTSTVKSARAEKEKKWDKFYRIWKAHELDIKNADYVGRAKTFAPFGHRAVEVFASRAPQLLFDREDIVDLESGFENRDPNEEKYTRLNTALLIKQFNATHQKIKWTQFFRSLARDGTAVAAIYWRWDTRQVYYRTKVDVPDYDADGNITGNHTEIQEQIREEDTYDAPDLRVIDIKNFFIDPTAPSLSEAAFVVEKTEISHNQLIRMANNGVFDIDRVRELKSQGGVSKTIGEDKTTDDRYMTSGFSSLDFSEKPYEVYEYWGMFEIEDEVEVEIVATMVGDKLIRFERNPLWHQAKPFIMAPYIQDDQSCYGISMLEPVEKVIYCANTVLNQTLDRTTQNLLNMWLKSRASNIKDEHLKFRPNGVIETNIMGGLEALRPNESSLVQAIRMLEYLEDSVQKTTGATNMLAGTENLGDRVTAFAVKSSLSEASVKLKSILDNVLEYAVEPYFFQVLNLNAQFYSAEDYVNIFGDDGKQISEMISPDIVSNKYRIKIYTADDIIQDSYQVQNMISYVNLMTSLLPVQQQISQATGIPIQFPDVNHITDQIWKRLGFKEPVPKIELPPPPPPMPAGIGPGGQPMLNGMMGNVPSGMPSNLPPGLPDMGQRPMMR